MDYDKLFIEACKQNDTETVGGECLERKEKYNEGFLHACRLGCNEVVDCLIKEERHDLNYQEGFTVACTNGYLRIAKALSRCDIDKHFDEDDAFVSACFNGYADVAQWLYYPEISSETIKLATRYAIRNGHSDVLKFLENGFIYVVTFYGCNSTPSQLWTPENWVYKSYPDALSKFNDLCPTKGEMNYLDTYDQACVEDEDDVSSPEGVVIRRVLLKN